MAMTSSSRPFGGSSAFPNSPAPTTSSSLNYSQYGSNSFASPSAHRPSAPSVSSSYSNRTVPRQGTGLRPSAGGGGSGSASASGDRKVESRDVARIHYRALRDFLREWLENESASTRASARDKLTRLTKLQFQELSTDVYDELQRRLDQEHGPNGADAFLPVREDFHPKRNQARQKLATLPRSRFRDLASDVFYELRRRYPEFQEEETEETMFDDEPPPAPGPVAPRNQYDRNGPTAPVASHQRQGSRNVSGSSSHSHPSRDGSRDYMTRPNGSAFGGGSANMGMTTSDNIIPNKSRMREEDVKVPYSRDSTSGPPPQPLAPMARSGPGMLDRPTNDVVIPNKSRLREENIEVPFSRDDSATGSSSTRPSRSASKSSAGGGMVDRPTNDVVVPNRSRMREEEVQVPYARESRNLDRPRSSASSRPGSVSSQNHDRTPRIDGPQNALSPHGAGDDREYYDRMSFSSNITSKSRTGGTPGGAGLGWDEEREQKIRAEYEFRIAGLERKASQAEGEREAMRKKVEELESTVRGDDVEIRGMKERAALHASQLRSMQHELDIAKDGAEAARSHGESSSRQAQEEISHWKERCDRLEDELRRAEEERSALETANAAGGMNTDEAVSSLKQEIHTLVDELQSLSARNEALITERERDAQAMNEMEAKVEEYKRMYDSARVELRNLKATSMMFVPKPATDDHLPASPDGNIADINVLAFQTAIDGLLSAARSSQPSSVLSSMKSIVEAITEIGDDVKQFEARPNLDVDVSRLESLKFESTNRLNSLMQTARNHAMSSGLAPVSLIDAAAGHLSSNVVEIIKLLKIRRSGEAATMTRNRSSMSIKDMVDRSRAGAGTPTLDRRANTPTTEYSNRSGTPTESAPIKSTSSSAGSRLRDYAAGAKEYAQGAVERLREPLSATSSSGVRRAFDGLVQSTRSGSGDGRSLSPIDTKVNGAGSGPMSASASASANSSGPNAASNLRINSYASNTSSMARSDSFDYDHKPSVSTYDQRRPTLESRSNTYSSQNDYVDRSSERDSRDRVRGDSVSSRNGFRSPVEMRNPSGDHRGNGYNRDPAPRSQSPAAGATGASGDSTPMAPVSAVSAASMGSGSASKSNPPRDDDEVFLGQGGGTDQEWEDVKPYLENQSSALVNSIQNLLAAIRTGGPTPALNEHLSEVIAIASSIVAVSTDALPTSLRAEGNPLLRELVGNTNKLSEAQESAKNGGFDKAMRQIIASASFGVAKSLKSLMKLGAE
ncbi:hypothetical protein BD324DRAFT_634585 [Kockovaella imperatae]|uniref:GIT Spa2 homology (SHD) domain-containing protein n=1 Tax=Kockovaella imperatae TaxID=4999 RepID=A0A1Y1U9K1_9TREE|nr:hypothetical protein BD324DRAFT_634585 [Kockovaella imperatae]ORX34709.1 hypothetical protein BD324DRAFT_634585 [Kockovaella imperatae]